MPEYPITHDALSNIAHHLSQETRYFEQAGDEEKRRELEPLTDVFDEASRSGVREITPRAPRRPTLSAVSGKNRA